MLTLLEDLIIDRVDLCDEGANSEAFIELYKRREKSSMDVQEILKQLTPEHAKVIQDAIDSSAASLKEAQESFAKACEERDTAKTTLENTQKELEETKTELEAAQKAQAAQEAKKAEEAEKDKNGNGTVSFDQTETFKSMPKEAREYLSLIKQQKEAAEEELRKSKEAALEAEAVAKAASLKAIPVEPEKLASVIKSASPEVVEMLETINSAIENTVLSEVGKSAAGESNDAWAEIDSKANEIAKRDNITKAKAVSQVISENPELYRKYLKGGAN